MDALVVGLPRSGTTLVANLMHNPAEGRICLVEPLINGKTGNLKKKTLEYLDKVYESGGAIPDIFKRVQGQNISDILPSPFFRWAIKEVRIDRVRYAYEHCKPKVVVFVIRDLHDLMLSSYHHAGEKIGVDGKVRAVKGFMEFYRELCDKDSWDKTKDTRTIIFFYEGLVNEPEDTGAAFDCAASWPLNGDPNRDLADYDRADEIRDGFKPRRQNPIYPDEVLEIVNQCQDYQETFGYKKVGYLRGGKHEC